MQRKLEHLEITVAEQGLELLKVLKLLIGTQNANLAKLAVQDPARDNRLDNVRAIETVHAVSADNRGLLLGDLLRTILADLRLEIANLSDNLWWLAWLSWVVKPIFRIDMHPHA